MHGKFDLFQDAAGEWRWNLVASNGRVVATSEGYKTKAGAQGGARAVQRAAANARVVQRKLPG